MSAGPSTGLSYDPLLEYVLAARWGRYNLSQFDKIDKSVQAFVIAAYRCTNQMEGVVSHEAQKAQKRARGTGRRR